MPELAPHFPSAEAIDRAAALTRVGIIGMGRWGRRLIGAFDNAADMVVCANRGDLPSIRWLGDAYPRARHTTDVASILADSTIDAIAIATPIATHAELTVAALRAQKHVFVEKPLATSVDACNEAIAAVRTGQRQLMVGHIFLYDAGLQALYERTRTDAVREIELVWHKFGTFDEPLAWNLLPHEIAILLWLTDASPIAVTIEEAASIRTELDRLCIALDLPEQRRAHIEIDRTRDSRRKTAVVTTASGNRYRWSDGRLDGLAAGGAWQTLQEVASEPLINEVRAFLAATVTGMAPISDGQFARRVTSIVADVERRATAVIEGSWLMARPS